MSSFERVVITGMGIASPIGNDLLSVTTALRDGRSGVGPMPEWGDHAGLGPKVAALVRDLDPAAQLPRKYRRTMGRVAQLCAYATQQAIQQAGIDADLLQSGRLGLAVGSTIGSPAATLDYYRNLFDKGVRGNKSTSFLQIMGHTCAANVALVFGINGRVWGPNSACTSSSQSIGLAYETLKLGVQDVMICGGAEEAHFTTAATFDLAFAASRHYNERPQDTPRPFDRGRDGMVVGEGAGILVLERESHAKARGARILGEVAGFATTCDGEHITSPAARGMRACMEAALRSADLTAGDIDYINAHATGTEAGDPAEAQATAEVFGDRVPVSSTKGQTGHTLGACGAIESIFGLIAIAEGFVPAGRNLGEVDPACEGPWLLRQTEERPVRVVMNNNFAFGGINTSLVFRAA